MEGVEVWFGSLDWPSTEIAELSRHLDAAELRRASRFRALRDQQRYVVSRGILRSLLGDYTGIAPDRIEIRILPGGKPTLGNDGDPAPVCFNLSHCNDMIVLAFSSAEVGIDIQREEDFADMPRVVKNFFSAEEAIAFERLAGQERSRFFFRTWVRKEAYMKATGEGLAVEPSSLTVSASPASSVRITREDNSVYLDHRYQIHDIEVFSGYSAAAAVFSGGENSIIPVVRAFSFSGQSLASDIH